MTNQRRAVITQIVTDQAVRIASVSQSAFLSNLQIGYLVRPISFDQSRYVIVILQAIILQRQRCVLRKCKALCKPTEGVARFGEEKNCGCMSVSFCRFLADRTATQYDRLLAAACCLSVCLSVCDAVHSDSQGWCTGLKVVPTCSQHASSYSSLQTLFLQDVSFSHKMHHKNRVEETRVRISITYCSDA